MEVGPQLQHDDEATGESCSCKGGRDDVCVVRIRTRPTGNKSENEVRSPVTFVVRKFERAQRHQAGVVGYQRARPPSRLQLLPTVVTMIKAGG